MVAKDSKDPIAVKAKRDILARARSINRQTDQLWSIASKAPVFCKTITKQVDGKKVQVRRSARLISAKAYDIAISGAARAVAKQQAMECKLLNIPYESTTNAACLPGFMPGAKYMLEQFMAAYVQEGMYRAKQCMDPLKVKRVTRDAVKTAFEETNNQIFSALAIAPTSTIVVPLKAKGNYVPSKAEKKEGEQATAEKVVASGE